MSAAPAGNRPVADRRPPGGTWSASCPVERRQPRRVPRSARPAGTRRAGARTGRKRAAPIGPPPGSGGHRARGVAALAQAEREVAAPGRRGRCLARRPARSTPRPFAASAERRRLHRRSALRRPRTRHRRELRRPAASRPAEGLVPRPDRSEAPGRRPAPAATAPGRARCRAAASRPRRRRPRPAASAFRCSSARGRRAGPSRLAHSCREWARVGHGGSPLLGPALVGRQRQKSATAVPGRHRAGASPCRNSPFVASARRGRGRRVAGSLTAAQRRRQRCRQVLRPGAGGRLRRSARSGLARARLTAAPDRDGAAAPGECLDCVAESE